MKQIFFIHFIHSVFLFYELIFFYLWIKYDKRENIIKTINLLLRFHIKVRYSTLFLFHLMPVGVPQVPFRNPGDEDASWVDV